MNSLRLNVTAPAPVTIDKSIKNAAVLNRTMVSKENSVLDQIDKVLTFEGKNLDQDGSDKVVSSIQAELSQNNRFDSVFVLQPDSNISLGGLAFPAPLSWTMVDSICEANQIDALFELSYYDTDMKVNFTTVPVEVKPGITVPLPTVNSRARVTTIVKTGWRVYDRVNKIIIDEFSIMDQLVLEGRGLTPVGAVNAIKGRYDAIMNMSYNIGIDYAQRLLPLRFRVSREYYVKGTMNFKIAKRRAQTGDWDGAAELWDKEVDSPRRKIAGRACYNMAIINEINGDLDNAIEWASHSYVDYKNKQALRYLRVLKRRRAEIQQVNQQLDY